jgi:hypothetical protein
VFWFLEIWRSLTDATHLTFIKYYLNWDLKSERIGKISGIERERSNFLKLLILLKHYDLYKIRHVHRHLINLRRVVLLNIPQYLQIIILDKVYRDTLAAKSTGSTNPMDIELSIVGQVVIDDQ